MVTPPKIKKMCRGILAQADLKISFFKLRSPQRHKGTKLLKPSPFMGQGEMGRLVS
jgi:hypothetical protein